LKNFSLTKINSELKIVYSENNTISIVFQSNELLSGVLGEFNNNLKQLEKITDSNIYSRGNSILLKNNREKNEILKNAIQFLSNQFLINGSIEKKDIESSLNKFMINEKDTYSKKNIDYIIKTPKKSVIPRSEKQKNYIRALKESDIIISAGPAGTGKTFLSVAVALTMLLEKKIERIILSRPAVEAGERLGFLPGDMREKVDPYLRPLYDSLYDLLDYEKIQKKIEVGDIEIAPLAFMRGRTLKNSFAILDEAQNATDTQIKMFLTRIGENSKIVINGDPSQIDLPNKNLSGLERSKKLLRHLKEISIVDFDHKDVVRHPLVSKIVKAYSDKKLNND
jgi:phosphate starvation-inducible PhoH-like protein